MTITEPGLTDEAVEQIEATMPKCTRCGGLIHSVDECSIDDAPEVVAALIATADEQMACIFCGSDQHWSMSCTA